MRRIADAVLPVDRTGIPWRCLPHGFAPRETGYGCSAVWQKKRVFDQPVAPLRRPVHEAGGRRAEPSAWALDAQSVKTSADMPAAGLARAERVDGRRLSMTGARPLPLSGRHLRCHSIPDYRLRCCWAGMTRAGTC
ncbi:hypothetical protein BIV25_33735 [Streptomyces sp. MUSC 14]|uniref:transposase n=1 Tax=Streptomyces sp. MUSC 14 TaxID=1354889 RepID=UPI0008F55D54|nr:transposase [Streptomyces sp. MUSC 14]OIJ89423.1 hypothetical protein BIV25_33735 [Streptomyces sp. MUSC 14]